MPLQEELAYAVRPRVVAKYGGQLCLVVAALTLVPLTCALFWKDFEAALGHGLAAVLLGGFGALTSRFPPPRNVQTNEALVISAGVFVVTSLVMVLPFMAAGLDPVDAWFESVSAVTTTGLSVAGTVDDKPLAFLFGRAWMQWYGGLGFVVLSLGLSLGPASVARRLALTETGEEHIVHSTRVYGRRALSVYGAVTGLGVLAVWLAGCGPLDAVLHTLAAVSTGGFSSHDDSLAAFPFPVQAAIIVLALVCSLPLPLYILSSREAWRRLVGNPQVWALAACGLVSCLLLFGLMAIRGSALWPEALRQAFVNGLSAQSTAGFSATDVSRLDSGSKLVMIASMVVGGGAGSTAGGVKLVRLLILLRVVQLTLFRTMLPPHAASASPRLAGRRLDAGERETALFVVAFFSITLIVSWLPFVASGHDPLDSLFEVTSATGTVGLSTGIASSELPTALKAVLCVDMLMGRLEIVAFLVLLYPGTWLGRRNTS